MTTLLHVEASPRGKASASTAAARSFLRALDEALPDLAIDRLDLWREALPEFDGPVLAAKYARLAGRDHGPAEVQAWAMIEEMVGRLRRADRVLISTPMWNFGIPYKLKHFIDLVTQPGLSFSFSPAAGYAPLLEDRPTLVVLASAGDYATGTSRGRPDLATPYLRAALRFIGLADLTVVPVGPTVGAREEIEHARAAADARLRALVPSFAGGRA